MSPAPRSPRNRLRTLAISPPDLRGRDLLDWVAIVRDAGVDAAQIRLRPARDTPTSDDRSLDDRMLAGLHRAAVERARRDSGSTRPLRVLINGRADLALAAGADGVHLPSTGVPPARLERWRSRLMIGLSTHRADEIAATIRVVDYVTYGPFAPTPSKPGLQPPGADGLRRAVAAADGLPVLALGGIDASTVAAAARAGASGVAAIRAFADPVSARRTVEAARAAWPSSRAADDARGGGERS